MDRSWRTRRKAIEQAADLLRSLSEEDQSRVWQLVAGAVPRCRAGGCREEPELHREHCPGHRKRLQRTGQLGGPLRPYRRRTTREARS